MGIEQSPAQRQLVQDMRKQLLNCVGFEGDELSKSREDAYKYYFQRARGDEIAGRSSIVTGDLSSMVEGNLAQMTEPLSNRRIAEFCGYDKDDEEQAQIESDCINDLIFKRQNGFIELVCAIKDAMLLRNGFTKTWIDERTYSKTVRKENVNPMIVMDLMEQIAQEQNAQGVEITSAVHTFDERERKISITVNKVVKKFSNECLAPENLLVPKTWHRQDFVGIPFISERHVEPRSALRERNFKKSIVDALPKYNRANNVTNVARMPQSITVTATPVDSAAEEVEWFECYVMMDDGNGASEQRCICITKDYLLQDEESDGHPYSNGAIFLNPHTFIGISLFDKLKSTQDSGTALTRALHDNLNTTNKNRSAHLDGVVEEVDITDGRTNGSVRVKPDMGVTDVRQAFTTFGVPDTSPNILQNLEANRRTRSEMGGAALDMATGQMQLNDRLGSQGLDRAYSVMEMLAAFMTKTLANTLVRGMFLKAHEVLRTQWKGPINFKRGKDWLTQNPSQWKVRDSVQVNLAESRGERARLGMVFEKVMSKQEALAAQGMEDILVNASNYYSTLMQWLRINDIPNPEQHFLDPRTPEAQQAFKQRALSRQQQQQKQDALMQQAIGLEQLRTGITKYQTDVETQFKYWAKVIDAQIEEARLATGAIINLKNAKATAEAKTNGNGTDKDASPPAKGEPATVGNSNASTDQ